MQPEKKKPDDRPYRIISTTADIGLTVTGNRPGELFSHALHGLNHMLFGEVPPAIRPPVPLTIRYSHRGDSYENLLVHFLSEVLFLCYHRRFYTEAIQFHVLTRTAIRATLSTCPLLNLPEIEIKSVTYHNLKISDRGDGTQEVTVIFDI